MLYMKINPVMSDYLDPNNEELLKDFFSEAQMMVDTLEQNILVLENDPSNADAVDEIFRAAHTLKGSASTVQMEELASFTHIVEDVLDEIRGSSITVDEAVVDILLASIDVIKAMIDARTAGEVYGEDTSAIEGSLRQLLSGGPPAKKVSKRSGKKSPAKKSKAVETPGVSEYELLELREAAGNQQIFRVTVHFNEENPMNSVGGIQVFAALKEMGTVLKTEPEFERLYEDTFFPTVEYYLGSDADEADIDRKLEMPDVVTQAVIVPMEQGSAGESAQEAPSAAERSTSVPLEPAVVEEDVQEALEKKPQKIEPKRSGGTGSVLRVDSRRIDNLLNLVSETVITKATFNQISTHFADVQSELQSTETVFKDTLKELFDSLPEYLEAIQEGKSIKAVKKEISDRFGNLYTLIDPFEGRLKGAISSFRSTAQNLGRITNELHERVLQIRMVPISQIFSRFPRLVRDVSKNLGKKVNLTIEGEDTELDKSVIEDLLDPLIHCVRNSIDHGVELPADREAQGKSPEGEVRLTARNEGNMIVIEISDDGAGIDVERVKVKAIDRKIIHPTKSLSDIEAFQLIFEPGFSTAKEVTNISGRGVGLDVVKKQIEKLNGSVTVDSTSGEGTKFTIKLPLTLAIIQGLLVRVGQEIYAIPITSVLESHRIKPEEIKMIDNYEVFNLREDVVSLLRLNRLFKLESDMTGEYHFVVIVGSGDKKVGLMVDSLIGEEDVVIKPLKDRYTNSPGIAGATILGDGTVSLIIDVSQLLELGLRSELESRRLRSASFG